jgi:hypothetical protein
MKNLYFYVLIVAISLLVTSFLKEFNNYAIAILASVGIVGMNVFYLHQNNNLKTQIDELKKDKTV